MIWLLSWIITVISDFSCLNFENYWNLVFSAVTGGVASLFSADLDSEPPDPIVDPDPDTDPPVESTDPASGSSYNNMGGIEFSYTTFYLYRYFVLI